PTGSGLATRLASLGHDVVAGSRDPQRAAGVVDEIRGRWGDRVASLRPGGNAEAAEAELVVIATHWDSMVATARDHADVLAGRPVIAMGNGLVKVGREFHPVLPPEGSLSQAVQAAAPQARVVAAFQHVPAAAFADLDHPLESDVVICSDDDDARELVVGLVAAMPNLRAFDTGSLLHAVGIETFAAVLLSLNIRHKGKGTLRFLGLESASS
ncbi:MAG: NAD(P)-binding domain-containing protein, partial [Actinomycetes bacterium]